MYCTNALLSWLNTLDKEIAPSHPLAKLYLNHKMHGETLRLTPDRPETSTLLFFKFHQEIFRKASKAPYNYILKLVPLFRAVVRIRIHRIRMFLGLLDPDPDPLDRGMDPDLDLDPILAPVSDPAPDPAPSIIKQK